MHNVFTDADCAYVLGTVQVLHDVNLSDLHFDFHADRDGVLHLVNRDPIAALMMQVIAPTHTAAFHTSLTPRRVCFGELSGHRYCAECLPRRSMLFEAIADFDIALTTNSLVVATALAPVPDHLPELMAAQSTFANVDAVASSYAGLTAKVCEELSHLADPESFPCGPILLEAYHGVYSRLAAIHAATIGSTPVRAVLEHHARTRYHVTGSPGDVLVELAALSSEDLWDDTTDGARHDARRMAYCVQLSYAPGTLDHDLPVVIPAWVAETIGATAAERLRSPVFTGLTASELDTARRLWDPYQGELYHDLGTCVAAAVALR